MSIWMLAFRASVAVGVFLVGSACVRTVNRVPDPPVALEVVPSPAPPLAPTALPTPAPTPPPVPTPTTVSFPADVRPILARCQPCHFPGGKVYEKIPFDRPETVYKVGTKLFTRIKDEEQRQVIRTFLAQNP